MSILDRQVRRTRTRLTLNAAFHSGAWGLLWAAGLWFLVTLIERAFVLGIPLEWSIAATGLIGLIITVAGVIRARTDALAAAVVLDGAASLKERISSALTIRGNTDPFAQATLHDAEKIAGSIHVPTHVKYRSPDLWPWSLASVVAAVLFFYFMPVLNLLASDQKDQTTDESATVQERQAVEVALQSQVQKIKERIADKPALASLQQEIDQLELPDEATKTPEDVRREAVKKIENVADKLREKLQAENLDSHDTLKRELAKLEPPQGDDHASKLMQAMAAGDMETAKDEMSKLKQELEEAARNGDADAKKKLNEMAEKLDDFAKQLEKLAEQQKTEKDLENKGGLSAEEAKQLLKDLEGKTPQQIAQELQKRLAESGMTKQQLEEMAKKIAQDQQARQQLKQLAQAMQKMGKT